MTELKHWQNFIAGEWVDGTESIDVYDPATGEVFASMAAADAADIDRAVKAARACVASR